MFVLQRPGSGARQKRGVTIIEAIMVLSLLAFVLGLVLQGFQTTRERMLNTKVLLQVNEMATAARQFSRSNGNYDGINEQKLAAAGMIPSIRPNGSTTASGNAVYVHALDFPISVRATDSGGNSGSSTHFTIILVDIRASTCHQLIRSDVGLRATLIRSWSGVVLERPDMANINQVCGSATSLKDLYLVYG